MLELLLLATFKKLSAPSVSNNLTHGKKKATRNITFKTTLTSASSFSCFMYDFLLLSALLSCTMISRQFLLTFQMLEQMNEKLSTRNFSGYDRKQYICTLLRLSQTSCDFIKYFYILQNCSIPLHCHKTNFTHSAPLHSTHRRI